MLKKLVLLPVYFYRYVVSPYLPARCRYQPTCSTYMIEAVETHGVIKGGWMGIKRFCRCHPFATTHGIDNVPPKIKNSKEQ